jgi:hypothetical protein
MSRHQRNRRRYLFLSLFLLPSAVWSCSDGSTPFNPPSPSTSPLLSHSEYCHNPWAYEQGFSAVLCMKFEIALDQLRQHPDLDCAALGNHGFNKYMYDRDIQYAGISSSGYYAQWSSYSDEIDFFERSFSSQAELLDTMGHEFSHSKWNTDDSGRDLGWSDDIRSAYHWGPRCSSGVPQ